MVVAAGPVTNFIFSILAFALLAFIVGRDVTDIRSVSPRIGSVSRESAADAAGLQPATSSSQRRRRDDRDFWRLPATLRASRRDAARVESTRAAQR